MSAKKTEIGLLEAFKYAAEGIVATFKTERNFKIELCFAVFALVASAMLALEPLEWVVIILFIVVVLALELVNSALESLIDLVSPEINPLAKHAKDAMAGAVLLVAIGSAIGGLIIFMRAALRMWGV